MELQRSTHPHALCRRVVGLALVLVIHALDVVVVRGNLHVCELHVPHGSRHSFEDSATLCSTGNASHGVYGGTR